MTRSGIVAFAGLPNAGKSTLLNALVGEKLAAVSPKPQTTRVPVRGLVTDQTTQIVLVDPAGLMDPSYPLQHAMRQSALAEIRGADLVVHLHPLPAAPAPELGALLDRGDAVAPRPERLERPRHGDRAQPVTVSFDHRKQAAARDGGHRLCVRHQSAGVHVDPGPGGVAG